MAEAQLDRELVAFINSHISSVRQLETLLLLHSDASKGWSAKTASRTLCYSEAMVAKWLKEFLAFGLVESRDELFYYKTTHPSLDQLMAKLTAEYKVRPLKVIDVIVNRATSRMMSFMDAFKIRKGDADNDR